MDQLRKDGYALGRGRAEAQRLVERDVQRRRILMRGAILVQWRRRSLWKLRLGSAAKGPWARLFSRYLLSHMRAPRHGREVDSAKDPTRPPSPRAKLHATPLKHRMSDMYVRWLRPRAQSVPPPSDLLAASAPPSRSGPNGHSHHRGNSHSGFFDGIYRSCQVCSLMVLSEWVRGTTRLLVHVHVCMRRRERLLAEWPTLSQIDSSSAV